jgi:hypothetical protein
MQPRIKKPPGRTMRFSEGLCVQAFGKRQTSRERRISRSISDLSTRFGQRVH